ncbi:Uncharacterised protein [Mycobacterium tuberculosis]|nr:Uncharacterised protein [Mycobacterium tuberculosis]
MWWLVCSTIDAIWSRSPIRSRSRQARSIGAWLWYSAECCLV